MELTLAEVTQTAEKIIKKRGWSDSVWIDNMTGAVCIMGSVALACGANPRELEIRSGYEAIEASFGKEVSKKEVRKRLKLYDAAENLIMDCLGKLYISKLHAIDDEFKDVRFSDPTEWNDGTAIADVSWRPFLSEKKRLAGQRAISASKARVIKALQCATHEATEREIVKAKK